MNNRFTATVISNTRLTKDLSVVRFTSDMEAIAAGQYISIFKPAGPTPEGKAYSLASTRADEAYTLVVRKIGEYSTFLYELEPSDTFTHSKGYGHFNPHTNDHLVGLAGGAGISPVWSVIIDSLQANSNQTATLAYSTKSEVDAALLQDLKLEASKGRLDLFHHQTKNPTAKLADRINPNDYITPEATYLVCGSADFTKDMYRGLIKGGVVKHKIYTEVFFE